MNSIVEEAKKWVGYLEKASNSNLNDFTANAGDNNYTRFAVDYCNYFGESLNIYQAQPWCAMFVSVVFANVYGTGKAEEMLGGHFAYCPYGVANFKSKGIWKTINPKPGDVIMFKDSSGTACHVGIVSEAKNGVVYTIEVNTSSSSGVVANGGSVAEKSYSMSYNRILGYGNINYKEDITMTQYEELSSKIDSLAEIINTMGQEIAELKSAANPMIYNYIDDNMPDWAKATIQKLASRGGLKGDENGLNLDENMLRMLVINDRMGLYGE